jgi:4-hydroxyphenylpyruvate dioxygenase-like putative hemolysin
MSTIWGQDPDLQVWSGSMRIGGAKFVLNESTGPGSCRNRFLATNGEGVEHIALPRSSSVR